MTLGQLIAALPDAAVRGDADVRVTHFASDSRHISAHGLFVATRGFSADGHDFIDSAIQQGAAAVLSETPPPAEGPAPTWVTVSDSTYALAAVAAAFHGHPAEDVPVLATTGTNGKTTVSFLLCGIIAGTGGEPGLLSTVEVRVGARRLPTIFTTPPSPDFQRLLAEMRDAGCSHAVVEASSHGLHQHRMAAFPVAVAGFTNLSRDHLDYHHTVQAYRDAKARLFEVLAKRACFNIDDAVGRELAAAFAGPTRTVSARGDTDADIVATDVRFDLDGCHAELATPVGPRTLRTRLIGAYNLENALVALGMAELAGISLDDAIAALADATGAPGRLQRVDGPRGVFVDYAHTPDALTNALGALRPLTSGRLICVFGAGGDRDAGKRPLMAQAAAEGADLAIVTSDNPRTEDPNTIIAQIVAGLPAGAAHHVEADRAAAIALAVAEARPNDVVLIAGKGHEDYQVIGTEKRHFDDVEVAGQALARVQEQA